jgi:hypothetical protein
MPARTMASSSRQLVPWAKTPTSLPQPIVTPAFFAVWKARADRLMPSVSGVFPGT